MIYLLLLILILCLTLIITKIGGNDNYSLFSRLRLMGYFIDHVYEYNPKNNKLLKIAKYEFAEYFTNDKDFLQKNKNIYQDLMNDDRFLKYTPYGKIGEYDEICVARNTLLIYNEIKDPPINTRYILSKNIYSNNYISIDGQYFSIKDDKYINVDGLFLPYKTNVNYKNWPIVFDKPFDHFCTVFSRKLSEYFNPKAKTYDNRNTKISYNSPSIEVLIKNPIKANKVFRKSTFIHSFIFVKYGLFYNKYNSENKYVLIESYEYVSYPKIIKIVSYNEMCNIIKTLSDKDMIFYYIYQQIDIISEDVKLVM